MMLLGKIKPADLQIKTSNLTVKDVGCPLSILFVTITSKSQEVQLKFQSGKRLPSERRSAASSGQRGRSRKLRDGISIPNSKRREQTGRRSSLKTHPP